MRGRAIPADTEVFPFEFFEFGYSGAHENDLIVLGLHRSDQHEWMALETCLHHGADIHDRRVAGDQSQGRGLTAPEEDRLDFESVFIKQAHLLGHPDVALSEAQRWIADTNLL